MIEGGKGSSLEVEKIINAFEICIFVRDIEFVTDVILHENGRRNFNQ